ncbi:MAG: BatA domain-containing protein [Hymenobacter sp.]
MLTLTNPSALLALLGLLVPLAIHLWNRRPGREVAVGSLRWLAAGANRRLCSLRLEQVWLLLLRAALLAALAVALAGPAWRQVRPAGRGQVLVSPALADGGSLAAVRPTLDSAAAARLPAALAGGGPTPLTATEWRTDLAGAGRAV